MTQPVAILVRKRAWAMRRAETAEKALIRLVGNAEYWNVFKRRNKYLQTVADLTLAIDALRRVEGKPVRLFGS